MIEKHPNNQLLQRLTVKELGLLGPLEAVNLAAHEPIEAANAPIQYVHFVETGFVSVVADGASKDPIEIGLIGDEGMTGMAILLGDTQSPFETFVQGAGTSRRMRSSKLEEVLLEVPAIRTVFLRYARSFATQIVSTASANGRSSIEARLARWLLMVEDRMGRSFPITHEFLSIMLAVQRPGVTLALQTLSFGHFIRTTRGNVEILDRKGLINCTRGAYGVAEREYLRLFPALTSP